MLQKDNFVTILLNLWINSFTTSQYFEQLVDQKRLGDKKKN